MKKRLQDMRKQEVEDILGPGVPVAPGDVWLSYVWKCSDCETFFNFDEPAEMPAPCSECGGTAFEKITPDIH